MGLIGDGYQYDTGRCVQSMQITSSHKVIVDSPGNRECGCHWRRQHNFKTKVVADVAGVFITALSALKLESQKSSYKLIINTTLLVNTTKLCNERGRGVMPRFRHKQT